MKLSHKSEYALLALIDLAKYYPNLRKGLNISKDNNIPKKFLEQIFLTLKGSGYIFSKRGANGGYRLSKKPSEITMAEIVRLFDGAIAPVGSVSEHFYEKSPIERNKGLVTVMKDIRDYASEKLENTTIEELK